ncbi:cytochrome b [Altererythrobacter aquiaggeris]|uniref:cytochrome b n=1 Tax=Aestuarierythrobacter aquiaggeris TaxID=1898396 RepID=UPI0030177E64
MNTLDTSAAARRYSTGAMIFHWVIAVAVIVNWRIAEAAEHAASKAEAGEIMINHKALGITILVLTLARLAWRLTHKVPPLSSSLAGWEKVLARSVHIIFYVLLIGLPIGGWLGVSMFGAGVDMWGLFTVPGLPVGESPETGKAIIGLHKTGGEIMLYLIALHIVGALKHTLFDKDGTLWRMLPFGSPKG